MTVVTVSQFFCYLKFRFRELFWDITTTYVLISLFVIISEEMINIDKTIFKFIISS